jgi:hypothetical protein
MCGWRSGGTGAAAAGFGLGAGEGLGAPLLAAAGIANASTKAAEGSKLKIFLCVISEVSPQYGFEP